MQCAVELNGALVIYSVQMIWVSSLQAFQAWFLQTSADAYSSCFQISSDIFKRVLMGTLRAFQSWFSNDFSCVHFILVLTTLFSNMWTELLLHRLRFAASAWAGGDLFFSFLQFRFHSNMTIWYKKSMNLFFMAMWGSQAGPVERRRKPLYQFCHPELASASERVCRYLLKKRSRKLRKIIRKWLTGP